MIDGIKKTGQYEVKFNGRLDFGSSQHVVKTTGVFIVSQCGNFQIFYSRKDDIVECEVKPVKYMYIVTFAWFGFFFQSYCSIPKSREASSPWMSNRGSGIISKIELMISVTRSTIPESSSKKTEKYISFYTFFFF